MSNVSVVFYGRGAELGNFKVLSSSLAKQLKGHYGNHGVFQENVELRQHFFDYLYAPPFAGKLIQELHIFSHAIGAGLFLSYHNHFRAQERDAAKDLARRRGSRLTYFEVLTIEIGNVFTDDLIRRPWSDMRDGIRRNFAPNAFIKIWGCNSGVQRWVYHDDGQVGAVGPIDEYYFRALNEQHASKPSIAQAFADYFDRPAFGAESGSHLEVSQAGHWMKTSQFKRSTGHWPKPSLPHRLVPDRGTYREFLPAGP
jgi:hypothetical protein